MKNLFKFWLPFYLYAGLIFYMSSLTRPPLIDVGIPFFDKILHIGEYAVFGILASRAFKNSSRKVLIENFKILAILVSILYGISDEVHQGFVLERRFSILDMFADGIGGILGAVLYGRYYPV